jgi:restriction system protein
MNNLPTIPTYVEMMLPTLNALQQLGGSGTINEIYEKIVEIMNLPVDVLEVIHPNTNQSEVEYRLAWSRTYLKQYGALASGSKRGVWLLAIPASDIGQLDAQDVVRFVTDTYRQKRSAVSTNNLETDVVGEDADIVSEEVETLTWQEHLHQTLLQLSPAGFERLAQRLLRESGFIHVEVTGRAGDGGIDGIGIARINGFLSFQVLFQCKRYQGAISPSQIRDFRGAMQGRTDKGLYITTGTFTRDAVKEATRDGAPPIDLIDGKQLVERLKDLGLGVKIEMVEKIEINSEWFAKL